MLEYTMSAMKNIRKSLKYALSCLLLTLTIGLLLPEYIVIPVKDGSSADWNHKTFRYEPWGSSGAHKGIDIFGAKGTPVIAATSGIVIYGGEISKGGQVIAVLGPKWRVHYFAHLDSRAVSIGSWVSRSEQIGTLGDTGNAAGKQPHVHYSILSLIPIPWLFTTQTQGGKRMFYLDPHQKLMN
jgi:murein DD-endopeptidase MepM/ murein hydrolase activator NlpD